MPADMSLYPVNWDEIRTRILARAGGDITGDIRKGARCEWCAAENHRPHPVTDSKVVLTIAHLDDPDPMNCDEGNLAALCQKCHNNYDAPMRARNRANSKRAGQIEAGQMIMFMEVVK